MFLIMFLCLLAQGGMCSQDQSMVEASLTNFIKKMYDKDQDIDVRFTNIPGELRGKPSITDISFVRVPDARGEGLCLVGFGGSNKRKNAYVPFRVIRKSKVFVLTQDGKRGDVISENLVTQKETNLHERKAVYPSKLEDILGKVLKKDVVAGTVITSALLNDPVLIQKGEMVNIIAENRRLLVQAKGKALEKGKMGDSIRVKNTSSDREIFGKVVGDNTVIVLF